MSGEFSDLELAHDAQTVDKKCIPSSFAYVLAAFLGGLVIIRIVQGHIHALMKCIA